MRQRQLPGLGATGCSPSWLPAQPAAHEAAPCPSQGLFAGMQERNGLNQEVFGQKAAPSVLNREVSALSCGGGSLRLLGRPCTAQSKQPLIGLLRAHSLRTAPATCAPPQRDPRGLQSGRACRRCAAKSGGRERAAHGRLLPPERASGTGSCSPSLRQGWSVSLSFGLCSSGCCLGCRRECGSPCGNSVEAPMEQAGTSCRAPAGNVQGSHGHACENRHRDLCATWDPTQHRAHGGAELVARLAAQHRGRGAARVRVEGPAARGQAVNCPACLHECWHCHGEVRRPHGGVRG